MPGPRTHRKLERYLDDPRRRRKLYRFFFWARIYWVAVMTAGAIFLFLRLGGVI